MSLHYEMKRVADLLSPDEEDHIWSSSSRSSLVLRLDHTCESEHMRFGTPNSIVPGQTTLCPIPARLSTPHGQHQDALGYMAWIGRCHHHRRLHHRQRGPDIRRSRLAHWGPLCPSHDLPTDRRNVAIRQLGRQAHTLQENLELVVECRMGNLCDCFWMFHHGSRDIWCDCRYHRVVRSKWGRFGLVLCR